LAALVSAAWLGVELARLGPLVGPALWKMLRGKNVVLDEVLEALGGETGSVIDVALERYG
jgi:hypothetical protein